MKTILKTLLPIALLVGSATPVTAADQAPPKISLEDVLKVCRQYLIEAEKNNDPDWLSRFLSSVSIPENAKKDIAILCAFHHQGAHDMETLRMIRT